MKHHLRKMADRPEMLSTYEHDFGPPAKHAVIFCLHTYRWLA